MRRSRARAVAVVWILVAFSVSVTGEIALDGQTARTIARKIWLNEGSGRKEKLVWWNKGEEFASCGIGHFIWFTKDRPMWFFHAFPDMLRYITAHGARPPRWLSPDTPCIWNSYEAWRRAKRRHSTKMRQLTDFLDRTKGLQARYMIHRFSLAYARILRFAPDEKTRKRIRRNVQRLLYKRPGIVDPLGAYTLIDYVNFKGDGTLESERYQGKGWGLYQVLEHMDPRDPDPHRAFADAARFILHRLTRIAPPRRHLERFLKGWMHRVDTYRK